MARKPIQEVDLTTFIEGLFSPIIEGSVPVLSRPNKKYSGWTHTAASKIAISTVENEPDDWYVSSSLVQEEQNIKRKRENLIHCRVIVLDDIGTKVPINKVTVLPSCVIETSPNNYQWIYKLINQKVDSVARYTKVANFLRACAEMGITDGGGLSPGRVFRIPNSINRKYEKPFYAKVVSWAPDRIWYLDELAKELGVEYDAEVKPTVEQLQIENKFNDDMLVWLKKTFSVEDTGGEWVHFPCPWTEYHTPGRDDRAGYTPIGRGNNVLYRGFKCHHAHCSERTTEEFLLWAAEHGSPVVSTHGIEDISVEAVSASLTGMSKADKKRLFKESLAVLSREDLPDVRMSVKNVPQVAQLPTQDNVEYIVETNDISAKLNFMTREVDLKFSDRRKAVLCDFEETIQCNRVLIDNALKLGLTNRRDFENCIEEFAQMNAYHPFEEWVLSVPHDGKKRINMLYNTVTPEYGYGEAWKLYLRRWLIQTIQATFGWREPKQTRGVLVFCGRQLLGKTEWFKALAPTEFRQEGVNLDLRSMAAKDSIIKATKFPLVELGELESTFKVADVGALKNFLSNSRDVYRAPYGHRTQEWPRATSFFGSVNKVDFLVDETGSSRFWPIKVSKINFLHNINMQQLWREAYEIWKTGEQWWLNEEEEKLRMRLSGHFEQVESAVELAEAYMSEHTNEESAPMNVTEFARHIRATLNPKTKGALAAYLDGRLGHRKTIYKKRNCWRIPMKSIVTEDLTDYV